MPVKRLEGSYDTDSVGAYSTDTADDSRFALDQMGLTPFLTKEEEQVATRLHKRIQKEITAALERTKNPLMAMLQSGKLRMAMQDIAHTILQVAEKRDCLPKGAHTFWQENGRTRSHHTIFFAHTTLEHVLQNIKGQNFTVPLAKGNSVEKNLLQNVLTMSESEHYLAALGTIITSQENLQSIDSARTVITIVPHVLRILRERVKSFEKQMENIDAMVSDAFASPPLSDYIKRYEAKKGPIHIDADTPRTILVESNLLLAAHRAKKYRIDGMTFLDLVDQATFGIMWGIEKFEPRRNTRVQTYIMNWIRSLMQRAISTTTKDLQLSREAQAKLQELEREYDSMSHVLGRNPREEELQNQLGWSKETFDRVRKGGHITKIPIYSKEGTDLLENMADEAIHRETVSQEDAEFLKLGFKKLGKRERLVIQKRFGLLDNQGQTLEQIGKELGLTKERVRQIQQEALTKLQSIAKRNGLLDD